MDGGHEIVVDSDGPCGLRVGDVALEDLACSTCDVVASYLDSSLGQHGTDAVGDVDGVVLDQIVEQGHGMGVGAHHIVRGTDEHMPLRGRTLLRSLQTLRNCSSRKPSGEGGRILLQTLERMESVLLLRSDLDLGAKANCRSHPHGAPGSSCLDGRMDDRSLRTQQVPHLST